MEDVEWVQAGSQAYGTCPISPSGTYWAPFTVLGGAYSTVSPSYPVVPGDPATIYNWLGPVSAPPPPLPPPSPTSPPPPPAVAFLLGNVLLQVRRGMGGGGGGDGGVG